MTDWTEAEASELLRLRSEGLSASQVAAQLPGRTRGAVIGWLNRNGHSMPRAVVSKRARKPKPEPAPKMLARPKPRGPVYAGPADGAGVPFVERVTGQCAWPLWEYPTPLAGKRCCGRPVRPLGIQPYCEHHLALSRQGADPSIFDGIVRLTTRGRPLGHAFANEDAA